MVRHYRRPKRRTAALHPRRRADARRLRPRLDGSRRNISATRSARLDHVGLERGSPSEVAWPFVSQGIDAFIAVDDQRALDAIDLLQAEGIAAGETGAAGLAGLLGLVDLSDRDLTRERVLLICTEGWTGSRIVSVPRTGTTHTPGPSMELAAVVSTASVVVP